MKHLFEKADNEIMEAPKKASAPKSVARVGSDTYVAVDGEINLNLTLADLRKLMQKKEVVISVSKSGKEGYSSYRVRMKYKPKGVPTGEVNV